MHVYLAVECREVEQSTEEEMVGEAEWQQGPFEDTQADKAAVARSMHQRPWLAFFSTQAVQRLINTLRDNPTISALSISGKRETRAEQKPEKIENLRIEIFLYIPQNHGKYIMVSDFK